MIWVQFGHSNIFELAKYCKIGGLKVMAGRRRFELLEVLPSLVFKTSALNQALPSPDNVKSEF